MILKVVQVACVLVAMGLTFTSCMASQVTLGTVVGVGAAAVFAIFARMAQAGSHQKKG